MTTSPVPAPPAQPGDRTARRTFASLLIASWGLLAVVTTWAYWPMLDNGFVWDDGANLVTARERWDRGLDGLAWAFSEPFFGHYQPLTWWSYQLDALLTGATPRGVHATNLVLHLLASGLVGALAWWFAGRLTPRAVPSSAPSADPSSATSSATSSDTSSPGRPAGGLAERSAEPAIAPLAAPHRTAGDHGSRPHLQALAALLCATLFALHPIHVETVAWATERRDLLSTVLVLAAVLLHLRTSPADASASRWRGAVTMLHALAALARAQVSLPFVLLALDVWPLGRLASTPARDRPLRRLVGEKALSLAVAAASAAAAIWAQASAGALTALAEHGALARLVQTGYNLAFYPAALLYRRYWLPLYERPSPLDPLAPWLLAPAVAAGLALVGVWALRRRQPALTTAVVSYALLVLPVAGPAQSGVQLLAERYAYLATVPLLLLAGCFVATHLVPASRSWVRQARGLASERWRAALASLPFVALLVAVLLAATTTRRQTRVWANDETLWRHVLAHCASALADNNLGQLLLARGESGAALQHLVRALERAPNYPRPWRAVAAILEAPWPATGPSATWVAATLERAAIHQPGATGAGYASGLAWLAAGDLTRGRSRLLQVLALEPDHEGARLTLAGLGAAAAIGGAPGRAGTAGSSLLSEPTPRAAP